MSLGKFAADYLNYSPPVSTNSLDSNVTLLVVLGVMTAAGLALLIALIIAEWKIFRKAGKPGWAILIPFYNLWVWAKIAGRPGWWGLAALVLSIIPIIGWILPIIISVDLAKKFDRSSVFGVVWLWFFPIVGVLILGYGPSTYHSEITAVAAPAPPMPPTEPNNSAEPEVPMPPAPTSDGSVMPGAPELPTSVGTPAVKPPAPAAPERPMPSTPPAPDNPEPQGPPPPPAHLAQ